MTIRYFAGLETGDTSEIAVLGAGASVQSAIVHTGNYSLLLATGGLTTPINTLSDTLWSYRFYHYVTGYGVGGGVTEYVILEQFGATIGDAIFIDNTGLIHALKEGAQIDSTAILPLNQWNLIEWSYDLGAGGIIKIKLNGVLIIDTTHPTSRLASPTTAFIHGGAGGADFNTYIDDICIVGATTTSIGPGRSIARQGATGTPTYNAWTKNGAATAALCLSDTPFSTATTCTSSVSAAAQTMNIASFSALQDGHGTDVITGNDTINACKAALVAKRATSGNPSIRRRVASVDTDTAKAVGAADGYFDDGIWTATLANLNAMEAGMVKAADVNLTTVEDVWVMVDYTDGLLGQALM